MFILTNTGFHKIGYTNKFKRISVDTLKELRNRLGDSLNDSVILDHLNRKHSG